MDVICTGNNIGIEFQLYTCRVLKITIAIYKMIYITCILDGIEGKVDITHFVRKYNDREILALVENRLRPVFVYEDDGGTVQGYAFCVLEQHPGNNILTDIKTLYIDDLCVDESLRGSGIGRQLYDYVKAYAVEQGCHNITLNVWEGNESAIAFYKNLGMVPYKYGMETIL